MMHFFAIFSHGSAILDNRAGGNMKVTMIFVWKLISCIITEVRKLWKISVSFPSCTLFLCFTFSGNAASRELCCLNQSCIRIRVFWIMQDYFQTTYKFLDMSPHVLIPMHGRINLWPKHMLCGYLKYGINRYCNFCLQFTSSMVEQVHF